MNSHLSTLGLAVALLAMSAPEALTGENQITPTANDTGQLPKKMHSAMKTLPHIKVGLADAEIIGTDNNDSVE